MAESERIQRLRAELAAAEAADADITTGRTRETEQRAIAAFANLERALNEEANSTSAKSQTAGDSVNDSNQTARPATQQTGTGTIGEPLNPNDIETLNYSGETVDTQDLVPVSSAANSDDSAAAQSKKSLSTAIYKKVEPTPNVLHQYPTYTYGLSLHVLSQQGYRRMIETPKNFRPSQTLISSASRYQDRRAPEFTDDFYFDDLRMTTVIGLTKSNRGSNEIDVNFTTVMPCFS